MPKKKETAILEEENISPRQAKFMDLYIQTGNAKASAIQAGYSEMYADIITSRFPEKVRKSLAEALAAQGITSEKIAEKINVLLEAKRPIYKNNNKTGKVEKVGDIPDFQAVDKGITQAVKIGLGGGYAPEKSLVGTIDLNELIDQADQSLKQKKLNEPTNA